MNKMTEASLIGSGNGGNKTIVIDFLNVFSDFREIKYSTTNFHVIKHMHKHKDTIDFFQFFFQKYIKYIHATTNDTYVFVMKKLNDYMKTLECILYTYSHIDLTFVVIEKKYTNKLIDKNKDDFVCQYLCGVIGKNALLLSNDKYRDKAEYAYLFDFKILLSVHRNNSIKKYMYLLPNFGLLERVSPQQVAVPKCKLKNLIV